MTNQNNEFKDPKFLELLKKYQEMKQGLRPSLYLDSDEVLDLSEYYETVADDFDSSAEVLNYGLQLHPNDHEILKFLIQNLILFDKTQEAEELIQQLEQFYKDFEVKLVRAALYMHKQDYPEGLKLIKEVLNETADSEDEKTAFEEVGNLLLGSNFIQLALKVLKAGFEKYPDDMEIIALYAEACHSNSDCKLAIDLYNKMLDEDPYDLDSWIELTSCFMETEDFEKAAESLDFAFAIDDQNPNLYILKGTNFFRQDLFEEANQCYLKALELDPKNEMATIFASSCEMNMDHNEEAIRMISKALKEFGKQSPNYLSLCVQAGITYHRMEQDEKALFYLDEALKIEPSEPNCILLKEDIFIRQGKIDEAEEEVKNALDHIANKNYINLQSGLNFYDSHYYKKAIEYLEKVGDDSKEKDLALCYMAKCYVNLSMKQECIDILQQAIARSPLSIKEIFSELMPDGMDPNDFLDYIKRNWKDKTNEDSPSPINSEQ